jgi:drug/metabolite transporter (DMT)-like permease
MNAKNSYILGVFCSFASAFLWGTSHISGRWIMSGRSIDALSLCSIRYVLGALILLVAGFCFKRKQLLNVKAKDLLKLSILAFWGIVLHTALLLIGQGHTTAINSSLIMSLNPIMIMLLATFIGEKISANQATGVLISLTGSLMVVGVISTNGFAYNSDRFYGDIMIFAAAMCWALYSVFSRDTVKRLGGFASTTWLMVAGAIELLILQIFWPWPTHIPGSGQITQWAVILYISIFPTALAFLVWYEAMSRIKLSLLNIMQYLTPICTITLAFIILKESMSMMNVAGAILTLAGVMIASDTLKLRFPLRRKRPAAST